MHWEKSAPAALARSRPYQGVRVRDPVKELLRRKRSLQLHSAKATPPTPDEVACNNQSPYTPAIFGAAAAGGAVDGGAQCTGWKAPPLATGPGLQPATMPWSSPEYGQLEASAPTLAYPATTLTTDVYMQTLCPSYTMLTYTHTPLLTNFGTIPVGPAPASLPQMELPDSGLTYFPWSQPLTTISAMANPGVQFAPGSAALSGSPLVHMPLSMSLTAMIPQLETHGADPQLQILDLPQRPEHRLDPEPQGQSLDEDQVIAPGSPNLLDRLLEERGEDGEEQDKDSYSNSLFMPNV